MRPLGRRAPADFEHVAKYALADIAAPPTHVPVVFGVNWYSAFDTPTRAADGTYWIGRSGKLGAVRGGHCIASEPALDLTRVGKELDTATFYRWYDQGVEGACVGFGCSRVMSLLNRHRFDAWWLYDEARKLEGRYPDGEGAEVRSGLEILRTRGHVAAANPAPRVTVRGEPDHPASLSQGISAYRWATSVDQVLAALGTPGADHITLLNSWGEGNYPERVKLPATVLDRLLREGGEAGVITDR